MKKVLLIFLFIAVASPQVKGGKCSRNFGGCDKLHGLCWDTTDETNDNRQHNFCTCKSGFKFKVPATRTGPCVDIDECRTGLHSCDTTNGRCVNMHGSHRCVCNRGYTLDYTRTTCLRTRDITGVCWKRRRHSHRHRHYDEITKAFGVEVLKALFPDEALEEEEKRTRRCTCESGYRRYRGCSLCRDINECRERTSLCDLRRGFCHNSDGGYYCTCREGYVLGPCGYRCYRTKDRPTDCTASALTTEKLISSDTDGLNSEVTRSQLLDYITEKAARCGKRFLPQRTRLGESCTKTGSTVTQRFDLNNDRKTDLIVIYNCVSNKYQLKSVKDREAYWTSWTCWTECTPSCYGGVQTRTRMCKNGVVGYGRCKGAASEVKECYKGKKCALRVRKDANTLTETEKKDLVQAMKKYKDDKSTFGFHNAASTHVWPEQCMGENGKSAGCCRHGARMNFVMWHRAEMLNYEEGLTRHLEDKTLGLPYWNWIKNSTPPDLVWQKRLFNQDNPFSSSVIRLDLSSKQKTERSSRVNADLVGRAQSNYRNVISKLINPRQIHEFSEALEDSHNMIHTSICRSPWSKCQFSMASLLYASFDPIFMFHHTNVDRLFSRFQKVTERKTGQAWSRQVVLEPQENIYHFNEPFKPFENRTLTPFKKVIALSTIRNLYHEQKLLGYKYDTLAADGSEESTKDTIEGGEGERDHVPTTDDRVYIAQYERNTRQNLRIRYFIANRLSGDTALPRCNQLSDSHHRYLGSLDILGNRRERRWRNRQATLLDVNKKFTTRSKLAGLLRRNRITAASNIQVRACPTTKAGCTSRCPDIRRSLARRIPHPALLFYPKRTNVDIFKFEWARGKRMPTWEINVHPETQWIQFWGAEASNILQVSRRSRFRRCNRRGAKKFDCTSRPCALPRGTHYFIHKSRCRCRAGMKLHILASM